MRPWLPALLVIAAAFAGCADEGTPDLTTPEPADDHDGHDDGNETVHNTPPVADLTADVLNGTAPLQVNLTLGGIDADGDNLTWSLQVNGTDTANGTDLPATLSLNFTAGNHTVLLTVSDGNASDAVSLDISVHAAVEEAPGIEDRGWYTYDPATGLCDVKEYDSVGGRIYISALSGGTWVLAETNGVSGLQVEDNHPASSQNVGFQLDVPDCTDGDLVVV